MKRISLFLSTLLFCHLFLYAQSDWQKVKCISDDENIAVFTSEGEASKKSEVGQDAKRRLFYALFYKGVIGFNDTQPLITKDNRSYTDPFFNENQRYYDLRRWKLAAEYEATPITGCNTFMDKNSRSGFYNEVRVPNIQNTFTRKQYFWPIQYDELKRNVNMTQAPGWKDYD